jgi:hypothetical protein
MPIRHEEPIVNKSMAPRQILVIPAAIEGGARYYNIRVRYYNIISLIVWGSCINNSGLDQHNVNWDQD